MTFTIIERLQTGVPVLLDGATGTELARRGVNVEVPEWSATALLFAQSVLRQVHADYVATGAEIVTANTFRTHARNLATIGLADRAAELTRRAVDIAREAARGRAWVAGSQAPLEDCYTPAAVPPDDELDREHAEMAENLAAAGVDLILVETQNTIREAVAAARAALDTGLPVCVSFVCDAGGRLLSGESVSDAALAVLPFHPAAVLVNCLPADAALAAVEELRAACGGIPFGAYANVGYADPDRGWVKTAARQPDVYGKYAEAWLDAGAAIIGGCCGTTPEHIRWLHRLIEAYAVPCHCP
jgi:homocysteine S-methyltransferase